jgi:hypothetical protein
VNEIELMLTGQMEMSEFLRLLKSDSRIQQEVRDLVPADAVGNESHPIWKKYSFSTMEKYGFDLYRLLLHLHKFDLSIPDNLNIWDSIGCFYAYLHPEVELTNAYHDAFDLYLSAIMDCFDGPEVRHLVLKVIQDACDQPTKKKRLEYAKSEIRSLFHVVGTSRPRWIQGPEWPMGKYSPMQYVSKKNRGEVVLYLFQDVDTGEVRTVEQYY